MSKTLLILGASYYQLDAIRTARRLGLRVVIADNVPTNPGHREADASHCVDTTDREAILSLARHESIDGVIAVATDVAVPTVAYVATELGLPGPPREATDVLCEKIGFRRWQSAGNLPTPRWRELDGLPLSDWSWEQPSVIKPNRSSGSKGVFLIHSPDELSDRIPEARSFSMDRRVLVEKFLRGSQGTAEGYFRDGRLDLCFILDRSVAEPPSLATRGHQFPSKLASKALQQITDVIQQVAHSLGLREGPVDADFVFDGETVWILEMTPRLGGNSIVALIRAATGIDLVELAVQSACGLNPPIPRMPMVRPAAVRILGVGHNGRLRFVEQEVERLRSEPWVAHLVLDLPIGAEVRRFMNGRDRVGEAILIGESLPERLQQLEARLQLQAD